MKIIHKISFLLLLFLGVLACTKYDTDFRSFLGGHEIVYPGPVNNLAYRAGNLRAGLVWKKSPDPSILKYVVYWNNMADSMTVNAADYKSLDSVMVIIPGLNEYIYSFTVISYDTKGNKSIPIVINNVKVYGSVYQDGLSNRPYRVKDPYLVNDDGSVTLYFKTPDTINISTSVKYINNSNATVFKEISPKDTAVIIPDYKRGSDIYYRSSYIPVKGAIDTFVTSQFDIFPKILRYVQCDKTLFTKVKLPNDMNPYGSDTDIDRLWDGSVGPQGYPNIFHSDGVHSLPQVLTFDMGKIYNNLSLIEETGRNCCHNPDEFEIWGIDDITNASTTLQPNDQGWAAESVAKGWTLLKDVKRTDDGQSPLKVDLNSNPPQVRYIRIRIIHNIDGDTNYTNMSEITLWDKQL